MKIISELIDKMEDTLEEAEWYGAMAMHYRSEYKAVADTFAKSGDMHITMYGTLHDRVVALIEEEKKKGVEIPKEMQFYYDQMHKKMIARYNKAKFVLEEYKKMGY
jgi:predicted SpoU family rRNA methylase